MGEDEVVAQKVGYRHLVEVDNGSRYPDIRRDRLYDGSDHADAMAAWSKAIESGVEYVTLESIRADWRSGG